MNLVLIQSQGRNKPSLLTRIVGRTVHETVLCNLHHKDVTREGALAVVEEFRTIIQPIEEQTTQSHYYDSTNYPS